MFWRFLEYNRDTQTVHTLTSACACVCVCVFGRGGGGHFKDSIPPLLLLLTQKVIKYVGPVSRQSNTYKLEYRYIYLKLLCSM